MRYSLLSILCLLVSPVWMVAGQTVLDRFSLLEEGAADSTALEVSLPSVVQEELLRAGRIPHPFVGTNEEAVQWVSDRNWIYRTSFDLTKEETTGRCLRLEWVDTFAEIYLNGALLGRTDNLFRTYSFDLDGYLRPGTNRLVIRLLSPTAIGQMLYESNGFDYPADNDRFPVKYSPYIRTAPYHFGWDWAPRLISMGLHAAPLIETKGMVRHEDLHIRSEILWEDDTAQEAELVVEGEANLPSLRLTLFDPNGVKIGAELMEPGEEVRFPIAAPKLWMPNGMGEPYLYLVRYETEEQQCDSIYVGLREIRLDRTDGAFRFVVNRRPFYAKGANYLPHDRRFGDHGRTLEQFFREDVVPSHFNMLRVWGGGIYETEEFYNLADRYGILIWQDFPFACSTYPSDPAFLAGVREEAKDQLSRLRNHPSLALLCGNNEVREGMRHWGWQRKYSPEVWAEMEQGYVRIFEELLPKAVARYTPHVDYIHGSPLDSNWGDLPSLDRSDAHYWGMWFGEEDYTTFDRHAGRFASEFGLQSFPEMKTIRSFAPETDSLRLDHPLIAHRQRSPGGNERLRLYLERDYPAPRTFDDFVYLSLLMQRDATGYAIRAIRRAYPHNSGSLYWQINDVWPTVSWSSIDYWGNWKALHYAVERAYRPTIVDIVADEETGRLRLALVSDDLRLDGDLSVSMEWFRMDGSPVGEPVIYRHSVTEIPFSTIVTEVRAPAPKAEIFARLRVTDREGKLLAEQLYHPARAKEQQLPEAKYEVTERLGEEGLEVRIRAKSLIRDLFIETPWLGARYSDNYFDLLPGETKRVLIRHPDVTEGALRIRTLNDLIQR